MIFNKIEIEDQEINYNIKDEYIKDLIENRLRKLADIEKNRLDNDIYFKITEVKNDIINLNLLIEKSKDKKRYLKVARLKASIVHNLISSITLVSTVAIIFSIIFN